VSDSGTVVVVDNTGIISRRSVQGVMGQMELSVLCFTKGGGNSMRGAPTMMDRSKRDSSTAQADAFAGANAKKRRRLAPVGMTAIFVQREASSQKLEAKS
jgi:hypothetical protein